MNKPKERDFKADLLEELKNQKFAKKYLNAVFEDGSREKILLALRDVCYAQGMTNLARIGLIRSGGCVRHVFSLFCRTHFA